jgi:hypothetical protein
MDRRPQPQDESFQREIRTPGYFERARQRAQRRKSPWNVLLVPLVFCGVAAVAYTLFRAMWRIHTLFFPAHAGRLSEFWQKGISCSAFVSSFILLMPLLVASVPLGMILANAVAWCIRPARRAFNREAQGVKWAAFPEAMGLLWPLSLIVVPICLVLSFVGAATLKNLR